MRLLIFKAPLLNLCGTEQTGFLAPGINPSIFPTFGVLKVLAVPARGRATTIRRLYGRSSNNLTY